MKRRMILIPSLALLMLLAAILSPARAPAVHDIAVTDVMPSPTSVIVGNPVYIDVYILNEGTFQETFDVNVYYDSTLIGAMSVTLSSGASTTLTFTWDTNGVSVGTYTVKAEVPPVPEEEDVADNVFIDGTVTIIPRALVPEFDVSIVIMTSVLLICCLLMQSRALKREGK